MKPIEKQPVTGATAKKADDADKNRRLTKEEKGPQGPNYNASDNQEDGNATNNANTFR